MNMKASGQVVAKHSRPFTLKVSVASLVAVGVLSGASVWAQEIVPVASPDGAVVTVTGVRLAAQNAQTLKKNAEQVVDSIVADDIGKFPDKNVAEILGRVSGVQVQRGGGEAGSVIIRGLGGIVTLLNGREFFSDAGRSLYLSDLPANMVQRIDVYKTQGGDLPEGGTSGVIDVRTNRPFDFKDAQVSINARIENRDKAKTNNPDLSAMYSNRWKTGFGEFGALAGLSYQKGSYHDETAWVADPIAIDNGVIGACCVGRVLGLGERKRLASNVALQWRPSSELEFYAEGFHTKIDHDYQTSFLVGGLPNFTGAKITTMPGTNNLSSITNTNYDGWGFVSTQAKRDDVANTQGALGMRWDASPRLRVTSELARTVSYIDWKNIIMDMNYTPHSIVAGVRDGGGYIDYPGLNMQDAKNFRVAGGADIHGHRSGQSNDGRADIVFDAENTGMFSFVNELSAGVRFAERKADSIQSDSPWQNAGPNINASAANYVGLTEISQATGGDYGLSKYILPSRDYLLNNTSSVRSILTGNTAITLNDPLSYFSDVEKTSAIYGKVNFGFNFGGFPISGVAGARIVQTDQNLKGNSKILGVVKPVDIDTSRTDVLPSLAMKAKLTSNLIARVVTGKAIERAAFGDYNPSLQLFSGVNNLEGNGFAGNPYLKPTESTNVDIALEWYFAPTGSLTATVFEHKFTNRLASQVKKETYGGMVYNVNRQYNLSKANLEGFELSYRQFYDKLPGWMSGFGLESNFTYMKGEQTGPDGVSGAFLGQSKTSYNVVGLYEKEAWSARLAYNWRSKFLAETPYRGTKNSLYVAPMKTLDASLSYKISKNTTVTLDGNNLLNQAYNDYFNENPALIRDIRRYDRAIGLALHWKM